MAKKNNEPSVFDEDNVPSTNDPSISIPFQDEVVKETNEEPYEPYTVGSANKGEFDMGEVYKPLEGEVKRREYAANVGAQNSIPELDRVPEPNITNLPPPPPPSKGSESAFITGDAPSTQGGSPVTSQGNSQQPQQEKLNPDMAGLSQKDAKQASTLLVDAILGGYKQVWGITAEWVKVSDDKIVEWVMQDQISLDITIGINEKGEEASLREVYSNFNGQAAEALTVDLNEESFIKVREAMIREFTKRGWGLSDMQYIIQHFVRDAGQRAFAVYQLKTTINTFTKTVMANYEQTKKLREELLQQKGATRVEPSEPTREKATQQQRPQQPAPPPQRTQENTVGAEFVESYEMPDPKVGVSEVPFFETKNDRKEPAEISDAVVTLESEENK